MRIRSLISWLFVAVLALATGLTAVQAGQRIEWKNLRPNLAPLKDPLEGLTQDQRFDIETISWARALSTEEQKLVQNKQGIVDAAKYERQFKEAGISVMMTLQRTKNSSKRLSSALTICSSSIDPGSQTSKSARSRSIKT